MPVYGRAEAVDRRAPPRAARSGFSALTSLGPRMPAFERYASSTSSAQRRRVEHHVVVAHEQEGGALDRVERLVGGVGEAGAVVEAADERPREHRGDPGCGVLLRAAVDDQDREVVVVLLRQAEQRVLEPGTGVAGDDHRHDRRVLGEDLVGVVAVVIGRRRLRRGTAAGPPASGSEAGSGGPAGSSPGGAATGSSGGSRTLMRDASVPLPFPSLGDGDGGRARGGGRIGRYAHPMITALAGGVGAARFLRGLVQVVDPADVTVVVNTADDDEFHGLYVCPDLDSVTYTLAGAQNPETGLGPRGRDLRHPRRARPLRRRHLVPARRPGPRHPPLPHPSGCAAGAPLSRGDRPRSPRRGSSDRGCCR